ncbi:MAG: hypothetical protein FVQ81_01890 [Candidatus Glassbacteria bacterium]|nr:hypothetical protein [Candidatus Glassbacteria bacterium]
MAEQLCEVHDTPLFTDAFPGMGVVDADGQEVQYKYYCPCCRIAKLEQRVKELQGLPFSDRNYGAMKSRVESAEQERDEAVCAKNSAYSERNKLVAALSKFLPSYLGKHPDSDLDWEDDWRWIVFINAPNGQLSWHIHDSELQLFNHLDTDNNAVWDGHTTEEKYIRLAELRVK